MSRAPLAADLNFYGIESSRTRFDAMQRFMESCSNIVRSFVEVSRGIGSMMLAAFLSYNFFVYFLEGEFSLTSKNIISFSLICLCSLRLENPFDDFLFIRIRISVGLRDFIDCCC